MGTDSRLAKPTSRTAIFSVAASQCSLCSASFCSNSTYFRFFSVCRISVGRRRQVNRPLSFGRPRRATAVTKQQTKVRDFPVARRYRRVRNRGFPVFQMQRQQRAMSLHSPPHGGSCLLSLLLLISLSVPSWHSPLFSSAAENFFKQPPTSAASLSPETLLDTFVCIDSPTGTETDRSSASSDNNDDVFVPTWSSQLPCVKSRNVNIFAQNRVEPGNVLLMSDIDDTLIASGGWSWIGKSLGGTDDRYARGSDYPGFGGLLYLLGLGPHLRDAKFGNLTIYKPPLQIAVVTGRPNVSFFRPYYLLPHIDSILTRGARQITDEDDLTWKVGAENNMLSPKLLKGLNGRGELKVSFGLNAIRGKESLEESRVDGDTKFMFIGDTGERDPEVALALAAAEPDALLAIFMNVVRRNGDPHARQTLREESEDVEDYHLEENPPMRGLPGTEVFSAFGKKIATAVQEAAVSIGAAARRVPGGQILQRKSPAGEVALDVDFIELLAAAEEGRAGPLFMDGMHVAEPQRLPMQEKSVIIQIEPDAENEISAPTKKLGSASDTAGEEAFAHLGHDSESEDYFWPAQSVPQSPSENDLSDAKKSVLRAAGDKIEEAQHVVQRALHGRKFRSSRSKHSPPRVTVSDALADTRRFAIQVGGTLVDAIQLVYDVYITTDNLEAPQTCSALSARQAYAVGMKVGQKLRNIYDAYEHRWKHSPDSFNVAAPGIAGLTGSPSRTRRPLPLVFVKCNSVKVHFTKSPDSGGWRQFWNFFTESSETIDVSFVISNESLETPRSRSLSSAGTAHKETVFVLPEQLNKSAIGTPVAPYTTTLSAAAHAYVLGLLDLIDVSVLVSKTHQALRSQGPLSHSSRLPVLLDHLHDLEALKYLLFGRETPKPGPVRRVAEMIDDYLVSLYAFAKRATYVRAFPNRQQECVHDLQRALLEKSRATAGQRNAWQFNQGKLVAFGTPFASLVCEHDLALASIHQAGPGELVGMAVIITKVVREALLATERVKCEGETPGCKDGVKPENRSLRRNESESYVEIQTVEIDSERTVPDGCGLTLEQLKIFREYYKAMCEAFSPIACRLLEMRINVAVLQDLILLAETKSTNRSENIFLPRFGLYIFHDENVQDYFENLHQRPAAQFMGFLGNPLDYALQPEEDDKGFFEKWPTVDSVSRWKTILETLENIRSCNLLS